MHQGLLRWYSRFLSGLVLAFVFLFLPARAFAEPSTLQSASIQTQYIRTISTIIVLERLSAEETPELATRRAEPIVSVANKFLGPIGFSIRIANVFLVDSNSKESSYEAFMRVHSEWHLRNDARQLVLFLMKGIRPDGKVGLSFPMTSCDIPNALVMVAYTGSGVNDARRSGQTVAHEVGHVLGATHDDDSHLANGLFTLMYTFAPLEIGGFSEKSTRQIETFSDESTPAGSCYADEEVVRPSLEIDGPNVIEVMEGESTVTSFHVNGSEDPVFLKPEGLPAGSSYNVETGELRLLGDATVAKPETQNMSLLDFSMVAETFNAESSKSVSVYIHRQDHSPVFIDGPASAMSNRKGKKVGYSTSAYSPDGLGVKLSCNKLSRGSKLKVKIKRGVITISGKYRLGEEQVYCMATSANGLTSLKRVSFVGTRR